MANNISNANVTAATQDGAYPIELLVLTVKDAEIVRLTNHYSDLVVDNETYSATAELLQFSNNKEDLEVRDTELNFSLSGVSSTFTSVVLGNPIEGSLVELSRGLIGSDGELVDGAWVVWKGRVNNFSIQSDYTHTKEDNVVISMSAKSLLSTLLDRVNGSYMSDKSFKARKALDRSMEFMPAMKNFTAQFGKEK